jgi:hypothetical protein
LGYSFLDVNRKIGATFKVRRLHPFSMLINVVSLGQTLKLPKVLIEFNMKSGQKQPTTV